MSSTAAETQIPVTVEPDLQNNAPQVSEYRVDIEKTCTGAQIHREVGVPPALVNGNNVAWEEFCDHVDDVVKLSVYLQWASFLWGLPSLVLLICHFFMDRDDSLLLYIAVGLIVCEFVGDWLVTKLLRKHMKQKIEQELQQALPRNIVKEVVLDDDPSFAGCLIAGGDKYFLRITIYNDTVN